MLQAILRKTRADFASRPLQTALLFIVIAAAAATLSLALNVQASAQAPYDRLREKSNGADLWLTSLDANIDLASLATLDAVAEMGEPYRITTRNYSIRKDDRKQQFALLEMPSGLPEFDHPVVTGGRWLSESGDSVNEIVIDNGAARLLGIEAGEQVQLLTPSGSQPFTVVGFAVTPSREPAPNSDPAYAYILPATFSRLTANDPADEEPGIRAGFRLKAGATPMNFTEQAFAKLNIGRIMLDDGPPPFDFRTAADVAESMKEDSAFDVIFLQVFSVFALLAAGLIIANAVGGQVLSQLHDIGILKAVGFTPRQITAVVMLPNLALSAVAGLAGVGAGLLLSPFFLRRSADVLGVPSMAAFDPRLLAISLVVVVVIVAVFTFLPAWRAGRTRVVRALDGAASKGGGASRVAHVASRLGMPRVVAMGLADLSRRRLRSAMTIVALGIVVITATFSLGLEATFAATMDDPSVIGAPPYDIVADRDAYPDADARALLEASPEVDSYLANYSEDGWITLPTGPGHLNRVGFELRGIDGDLTEGRWAMREGRMPIENGEATVSTEWVRRFSLDVGDSVTFDAGGDEPITVKIVGRYVDIEGEVMIVKSSMLPATSEPSDYLIATVDGTDLKAFSGKLMDASGGNLAPEILLATISDIRDQFRSILVLLNSVLLAIAGINLLSSLLLSVREQRRDFAILKTVGFTPGQVVLSVFSGSVALALIAVVVGLPLGLVATKIIFGVLSDSTSAGTDIGTMPGLSWLLPIVPVAVVVAGLATLLPARRASSLRVAEAMRYE